MRSLRTIVVAGVLSSLALAATACGPGNDDKSTTTTTTAPTAATAAPTSVGTGTAAPAGKALTQDQLVKALLTPKDLDADDKRSTTGPAAGAKHKRTADKPACQPLLDLVDTADAATPPPASALGFYQGSNGREYTAIQLSQFAAGQAAKAMASAESALGSCSAFNATSPGQPTVKISFSKATYQAVGDATLAFNEKVSADNCDNAPCESLGYVAVRTGDVVTVIGDSALADPGQPEQATVKKQLDKLRAAAK
ncbi:hypothetical protein [Kitasatospora sp. NPDC097643]|uniref:hypothetical protein n=1 Tax=Kitasatospora sp. NPDC097643 TaxID=3157230 RepID=UPI00332D6EC9